MTIQIRIYLKKNKTSNEFEEKWFRKLTKILGPDFNDTIRKYVGVRISNASIFGNHKNAQNLKKIPSNDHY